MPKILITDPIGLSIQESWLLECKVRPGEILMAFNCEEALMKAKQCKDIQVVCLCWDEKVAQSAEQILLLHPETILYIRLASSVDAPLSFDEQRRMDQKLIELKKRFHLYLIENQYFEDAFREIAKTFCLHRLRSSSYSASYSSLMAYSRANEIAEVKVQPSKQTITPVVSLVSSQLKLPSVTTTLMINTALNSSSSSPSMPSQSLRSAPHSPEQLYEVVVPASSLLPQIKKETAHDSGALTQPLNLSPRRGERAQFGNWTKQKIKTNKTNDGKEDEKKNNKKSPCCVL